MPVRLDGTRKRQNWDYFWPTNGLRYGSDCRQCGRLLTSQDRHVCRLCRADFARSSDEHSPLTDRAPNRTLAP